MVGDGFTRYWVNYRVCIMFNQWYVVNCLCCELLCQSLCWTQLLAMGLSSSSWVTILCCRHRDCWGPVGGVFDVVDSIVGMIGVLLQVYCWWICAFIFTIYLFVGEYQAVGVVAILVIASSVVSLEILLTCSNALSVWMVLLPFLCWVWWFQ